MYQSTAQIANGLGALLSNFAIMDRSMKSTPRPATYHAYRSYTSPRYTTPKSLPKRHHGGRFGAVLAAALVVGFSAQHLLRAAPSATDTHQTVMASAQKIASKQPLASIAPTVATQVKPTSTACQNNDLAKLILVSISQRHLWACSGAAQDYDSAVVTGMMNLPADLTPVGTYHIYAKQTDTYLKGSDSTGSWNDYVYYWMPFLTNQYGEYGFHDATWRPDSAFGNIDPNSNDGSHGCVELPLATAHWLYDWAAVGTTVTIES